MPKLLHGHKVLDILSEQSFTREQLKMYLDEQYGSDILFHTCQSEGLDFDTLFDFFIKMGKVTCTDGQYTHKSENQCAH